MGPIAHYYLCNTLRDRIYNAIRDPTVKLPDGSSTLEIVVAFESAFPWPYYGSPGNSVHYRMAQDCSVPSTRKVMCPPCEACVLAGRSEPYGNMNAKDRRVYRLTGCTCTGEVEQAFPVTKYIVNQGSPSVQRLLQKLSWSTFMAVLEEVDRLGEW